MRWTALFIPTLKEMPADAVSPAAGWLVRAGLARATGRGGLAVLPMGARSLGKLQSAVDAAMIGFGFAEVLLPAANNAAAECITRLISSAARSYKQLPLRLFERSAGGTTDAGLPSRIIRGFAFHASAEESARFLDEIRAAFTRFLARCSIRSEDAEACDGHALLSPSAGGSSAFVRSDQGNYAAILDAAAIGERSWTFGGDPTGELEKVFTPGLTSVPEVARFLNVPTRDGLKTLVFRTSATGPPLSSGVGARWLVAVVRGDHEVNETKLTRAAAETFHITRLSREDTEELRQTWPIGFVGPDSAVYRPDTVVIVDVDAAQPGDWATGANEKDHHVKHFNWFRECGQNLADPKKVIVTHIRNATAGDPSPKNDGGRLELGTAIELARFTMLSHGFGARFGAHFLDDHGQQHPMSVSRFHWNLTDVFFAAAEQNHDDRGLTWPAAVAPFSVVITPIRYEGESRAVADRVYNELSSAGIDAILDDRNARPGVKFADADLLGIPLRITIGERSLKEMKVELKTRSDESSEAVMIEDVVQRVGEELRL